MLRINGVIVFLVVTWLSQPAFAADYRVEFKNLTHAIQFTPRIVIAHVPVSFFEPGDNLNDTSDGLRGQINNALTEIAEAGNLDPMIAILEQVPNLVTFVSGDGLLEAGAGQNQTVELLGVDDNMTRISLFSMLLPTNDGFVGLNNMPLPESGSVTYRLDAYDAGTETNSESCADIPGPLCGGTAQSPDDTGEGFVHIHRGIRGLNSDTIDPNIYDWKNPVAEVTVTRMP